MSELTARAVRITGDASIDALTFDEIPVAAPRPGEVLVLRHEIDISYVLSPLL